MAKELNEILATLPKRRKNKIRKRTTELIALELTLKELRSSRQITQEQISEILGIGQDSISRLENRSDIKLSTLTRYVEALGGKIRIIADFPDTEPVEIKS